MGRWSQNKTTALQSIINQFDPSDWVINSEEVRNMWLDYPEYQKIFADILTEEMYLECIISALFDINSDEPVTSYTPVDFPFVKARLWIKFSFMEVLSRIVRYHSSNQFSGASGGVGVPLHERRKYLQEMIDIVKPGADRELYEWKTRLNLIDGFGGIDEYGYD